MEKAARYSRAAVFGAAMSAAGPACEGPRCPTDDIETHNIGKENICDEQLDTVLEENRETEINTPFFDRNPNYLRPVPGGEFSKEERAERTETLPNGEKIFRDIGLTFYYVEPGDTLSEIRRDLSQYGEFSYLQNQRGQLRGFNIPAEQLQADMWIPIPMETEKRYITDEQMAEYAEHAIQELLENQEYADELEGILKKVTKRELIATVIAIAKQESGGEPIGKFVYHKWEPHKQAFSFSPFHVLMTGPGLEARRELDMTEGQTYHPKNAVKLFIGFLIEKTAERKRTPDRYFPIDEHIEAFATFYNGGDWRETNPNYDTNVISYYEEALKTLPYQ